MTTPHTWTAHTPRRRIRRRHAIARSLVVVGLGALGTTTVLVAAGTTGEPEDVPRAQVPVAEVGASRQPTPPPTSETSTEADRPQEQVTAPPRAPVTQPLRVPSTADPLRVWIAGDSMWEVAGPALATRLEASGVVSATLDVHYSSGLTRPDFFDWSARAAEVLQQEDPELVLVLVGANDAQVLTTPDGVQHQPGTEAFVTAYAERTRRLMAQLAAGDRHVVWVGLPVMRPDRYDARMKLLAEVHQDVAATVPGVTFVPTRALFSDADGAYAPVLPDAAGRDQAVRGGDGIHLSVAGASRLADHLVAILRTNPELALQVPDTAG